jgi:hypothetical protein
LRVLSIPWAGLAAGPASWALSTQANYALVTVACRTQLSVTVATAAVLAAIALAGAAMSFLARWQTPAGTTRFVAGLSLWSGVLFGGVIVLQAIAGLFLSGCER